MKELLTKRHKSWWLPRKPITVEVKCNRKTHRVTLMPDGKIRLEDHKKKALAAMNALEGKKECSCQQARRKWLQDGLVRKDYAVRFYGKLLAEKARTRSSLRNRRQSQAAVVPLELRRRTRDWLLRGIGLSESDIKWLDAGLDWTKARAFVQRYKDPVREEVRLLGPELGVYHPAYGYILVATRNFETKQWCVGRAYAQQSTGRIDYTQWRGRQQPLKEIFECRQ